MKMKKHLTAALFGALTAASTHAQTASPLQTSRDTRIGRIELDQGFPSKKAVDKLYDELDFQRACQAYIWGLPIIGFAEWQASAAKSLGAGDLDYVIYLSVEDKLGILTPNASTQAGQTYVFCSPTCKTKFDKDPEGYTDPAGEEVKPEWAI